MGSLYTVTGFTPAYWNSWGVSFFASWKEFASDGNELILVHNGDLPATTQKKLLDEGVILLPTSGTASMRFLTWKAITEYPQDGTFIYWDGDCYFQDAVLPLFDIAADKMVFCENLNPGMIGGPQRLWKFFVEFCQAAYSVGCPDVIAAFARHFPTFFSVQDNTWNFTSVPSLKLIEGRFGHKNELVRVVHPSGTIKGFTEARKFLFSEKYRNLFSRWSAAFKGSTPHSFLKRVHHIDGVKSE